MKFIIYTLILLFALQSCGDSSESNDDEISIEESDKTQVGLDKFKNTPKFCIKELIELLKQNPSEYENHLLSKGYQFSKSEDDENYGTIYEFNYPNVSEEIYGAIYHKFPDGSQCLNSVNWTTFNNKDYLDLKHEVEKIGFEYWNTSKIYNGKASSYKNDSLTVTFLMQTINGKTMYVVELRCLPTSF